MLLPRFTVEGHVRLERLHRLGLARIRLGPVLGERQLPSQVGQIAERQTHALQDRAGSGDSQRRADEFSVDLESLIAAELSSPEHVSDKRPNEARDDRGRKLSHPDIIVEGAMPFGLPADVVRTNPTIGPMAAQDGPLRVVDLLGSGWSTRSRWTWQIGRL
jgi:hypothetical protein